MNIETYFMIFPSLSTLGGDEVSVLTHAYLKKINVVICKSPDWLPSCGLMSDFVIYKDRTSMAMQDPTYPYRHQVLLSNTKLNLKPHYLFICCVCTDFGLVRTDLPGHQAHPWQKDLTQRYQITGTTTDQILIHVCLVMYLFGPHSSLFGEKCFLIIDILPQSYTCTNGNDFFEIASFTNDTKVKVLVLRSEHTYRIFSQLLAFPVRACNYWYNLRSVHQVPVTAGWPEAEWNVKFDLQRE